MSVEIDRLCLICSANRPRTAPELGPDIHGCNSVGAVHASEATGLGIVEHLGVERTSGQSDQEAALSPLD